MTGFLLQITAEEGRAAFSGIFDVGPNFKNSGLLPYDQWHSRGDAFCTRMQRKPGYTVGISQLYPEQWQEIWDLYANLRSMPGAENSVVFVETYNLDKARFIPQCSSTFPRRDVALDLWIS